MKLCCFLEKKGVKLKKGRIIKFWFRWELKIQIKDKSYFKEYFDYDEQFSFIYIVVLLILFDILKIISDVILKILAIIFISWLQEEGGRGFVVF